MTPAIAQVQDVVAEVFGVTVLDLKSHRRAVAVARPRQAAMALAKEFTPFSLPVIGRHFGGRDHTTVLHAVRKVARLEPVNADFACKLDRARQRLIELGCARPAGELVIRVPRAEEYAEALRVAERMARELYRVAASWPEKFLKEAPPWAFD